MTNDSTFLFGDTSTTASGAADSIREIAKLLTDTQTFLEEMSVSAGNLGAQIVTQMDSIKESCGTISEKLLKKLKPVSIKNEVTFSSLHFWGVLHNKCPLGYGHLAK